VTGVYARIYAREFDPPEPWVGLHFRLSTVGQRRHEVSVGGLSDAELRWVARVVAAEHRRRVAP
jgi:hypothetical protein